MIICIGSHPFEIYTLLLGFYEQKVLLAFGGGVGKGFLNARAAFTGENLTRV